MEDHPSVLPQPRACLPDGLAKGRAPQPRPGPPDRLIKAGLGAVLGGVHNGRDERRPVPVAGTAGGGRPRPQGGRRARVSVGLATLNGNEGQL
ncbi:hypothetical protein [Streptomyces sp. NPDC052811]|uniref:hypothetical protein n=1 Tax=Streptomyces sp. NPDC052811 TaxID=3155731 RepID=UPI003413C5BE